jgi:UDP-GlcNAc:undecaprenyl-phosphate/decaprenyl-phosphate GlcNAc-1-phosphate transferase
LPLEARLLLGLAVAVAVAHSATPLAIRVAERFDFYDRPVGYKGHAAPTPYLGGAAVVAGFVVAILLLAGSWDRSLPLLAGVVVLWVVGTIDDRRTVAWGVRVAVELALGAWLWALGLGWELGAGPAVDLAASALWVAAIVNAFNLFDNMDGAASSMTAVVAGGLALLGVVEGDTWLAVTAAALCGAAIGFLPHNLFSSPARIFLGDGGSMSLGFAVAAVAMIGVGDAAVAWQSLAMGLLFVGIPALDTALVTVSRRRRGISILTAGRDHLTHRARQRFSTARAVAVALGGAQAVISALAVVAVTGGSAAIVVAVVAYLVGLGVAITLLDSRFDAQPVAGATATAVQGRPPTGWTALIVPLALAAGITMSPFFGGFYDAAIWVPVGIGLLGVATAGLIARPPPLALPSGLLVAGVAGIGLWSLLSASWADSIERAVVDGNRWLAYAALLLVLLVVLRSERAVLAMLAALTAGCVAVGVYVVVAMLGGDPAELFLSGRLHEPLGYINGVGGFFLLGLLLCVAAGERREPVVAGLGAAGATLLAGLLLLTQSRGVALGAAIAALVVLVLVPGRVRRAWAMAVIAGGVALASPALLDVYSLAENTVPPDAAIQRAARFLALAAAGAGLVWGAVTWAAGRRTGLALEHAAAGVLVAGLLLALAVGIASAGRIADTVDRQYDAFVHLSTEAQEESTGSRLASGAGNRYDYWRVAWDSWEDAPLHGVGAGNYDREYFAGRATDEDIRQPHSIGLQLLSELGLVGLALLLLALAGVALGAWRVIGAARDAPGARTVAVACVGVLVAWLVHTSVDWLHLLPGVTAIALVAAVCLVRGPDRATAGAARARRSWIPVVGVALVIAFAALSLSRQALSGHFVSAARDAVPVDPAAALREADRALRIDPELMGAYYAKSAALARFDEPEAAKAALREAARREPRNFVTWALLGDLAVRTGDIAEARTLYARSLALNPRDPSLVELARDPRSALAER